jgi:hypothetical protein
MSFPYIRALAGAEKVLSLCYQLAAPALVTNIFLLLSCFVHRVDAKPLASRDGDFSSLFSLHNSAKFAAASPLSSNYGLWEGPRMQKDDV